MRDARSAHVVCFGPFKLDLKAGELCTDGGKIVLQEQPFRILRILAENAGEVVTREEIRRTLWPNDTVVEFDHSINAAIKKLRQALGDSADEPSYVETVARRGYRLMVPAEFAKARPTDERDAQLPDGEQSPPLFRNNLVGKRVSHYRVLEILGGGGMGIVYKAEDIKLGRRVALKFLPEELANDISAMERLEREARAASTLNHPNICTIYEVEEHQGQTFIVMEFLEGLTLRELISEFQVSSPEAHQRKTTLALQRLLDIGIQIAAGLDVAHKEDIIHRDIKPANIFVTTRGQVKILDFGLAKLGQSETPGTLSLIDREQLTRPDWNRHPTRTRTGREMGTAGYMSPEQMRGEKLDARTDLFSFGLVLYEMLTGQRAFTGDTAPSLRGAVLSHTPTPVRELNPDVPADLGKIVNKLLEKDRESRYQSAQEIRADLTSVAAGLSPGVQSSNKYRWLIGVVAGFALLAIATASFLVFRTRLSDSLAGQGKPSDLTQRQLTANSSENAVTGGAISPDGRYLAFADLKGIHVKTLETGETNTVPQPEGLRGIQVNWQITPTWASDGTIFLANAKPHGARPSIWAVPVTGGPPHMLRDDALAWTVSRDNSWVAFGANLGRLYYRELWLMRPDGGQARKLYEVDENSAIGGAEWSPDGQRLAYAKWHQPVGEKFEWHFESRDLNGGVPTAFASDHDLTDITDWSWVPDGRIIYTVPDYGDTRENTCNFWQTPMNLRTGEPLGKPKRLTNWSGFCVDTLSTTADGKELAFRRSTVQSSVYLADLQPNGVTMPAPRRLTLNEGRDYPAAWTPDSKTVVFVSNRNGQWELFRQSLDEETAHPIAAVSASEAQRTEAGEFSPTIPRITPDGVWILYAVWRRASDSSASVELMRVPVAGGTAQLVLTTSASLIHSFRCARSPATLCAIAERTLDHKHLIFTAFDPVLGRGRELAHFATNPTPDAEYAWDLSPDGTRIAILKRSEAIIHALSLNRPASQQIVGKGWSGLQSVDWSADGTGLFVSSVTEGGSALLRLDLIGNGQLLWAYKGTVEPGISAFIGGPLAPWAVPSPDGRHLAICGWSLNANIWLMENF